MEMVSETAVDIVEREGKDEKDEESNDSDKEEEAIFPFREQLNKVMQEDVLYRNPHLTITEVANAIGTNRTYLSAYLNNVLHTSFYDYINNYRIENVSKKLLAEPIPNKTIEEIAELSGFNSTSTFRRAFIKNTGMTPLHFRKVAMKDEG
jgi:AraC-like DNA-binding protein